MIENCVDQDDLQSNSFSCHLFPLSRSFQILLVSKDGAHHFLGGTAPSVANWPACQSIYASTNKGTLIKQ